MNVQSNWWESFFDGVAVDLWLQAMTPDASEGEADAIARRLDIAPGAEILDVPCGGGRIALPLAADGYRVTAVDWSAEFLRHARSIDHSGRVEWEQRDMRDLPWPGRFDGAFCAGNSFGYLDDAGNAAFLRAVRTALKPGARFLLETPMVLENLLGHLMPHPWWKAGDRYLLVQNHYDHTTMRLNIEYTFVANGHVDVRYGSHRAYTYRELVELMSSCGFVVEVAEPWTREAHAVTFIGTAA